MIKKRVNRNATMSLIVAFAMIFSIFSVIAGGNGDTAYLTKKLVSDEYTIEEGRIVMEGFYTRGHPGAPELPQKTYDIPLPPDAELETVQLEILASTAHIIAGEYDIGPGPLPAAGSGYTIPYGSIVNGKDTAIYGNNDFYPLLPVEI
ncbi:MAG: hypothetical protein KAV48_02685, partial [Methanomicrobia archaeon]|nr:hypothetical protein [Methanomicrobia archaeon]